MEKSLVSFRRLRRQMARGQVVHEVRGDFDRVHHTALRVAGMRVEAVKHERHRIGREAFALDLAQASAVKRVGAAASEPRYIEMRGAAPDLFVRREGNADGAVWD